MQRILTLFASLFAIALAAPALLAQPGPPQAQQPPAPDLPNQQQVEVTESDLDTFTSIYVELQEAAQSYEAEMSAAESPEEAQALQMQLQEESINKIEDHGWTPDRYNNVAQAINADSGLIEQAMEMIEEKS